MIGNLIKVLVVALVLVILLYVGKVLLAALGAPAIVGTILLCIVLLIFALWILRVFGLTSPW